MAAASTSTKRSSDDARQVIGGAREDIKLTFTCCQKAVIDKLERLTREADDILEKQDEDKKLKGIVEEVDKIQRETKKQLEPLQPPPTSDAPDNKVNIPIEDQFAEQWPKLDMKLEKILENAALRYKFADYKNLDGSLKNCLLCLAIFPQDASIKKRTLIYWWIGEGIVNATAEKTAEKVGEHCFKELLKGSWIDPVNNKSRKKVNEFKMDPWVRWLVIYLARKEGFFNLDKTGMPSSSPSNCPRDCLLEMNKLPPHPEPNPEGSSRGHHPKTSLLSVFNVNAKHLSTKVLSLKFKEMARLLVLHLGRWQTSAERDIQLVDEDSEFLKLSLPKRLRYLSLAGISRITLLPTSVKNLSHLKILDLRSCQNLEHLGEEIIFLKGSLTHLDVSECYMLDHMPKGLGSLAQLEVLKGFIFGSLRSKDSCQLAELTKLKKLRKLSISIGGEAKIQPKEMTRLKEINGLRSLAITWGKLSLTLPKVDRERLEGNWTELSYPSDLEKLDLRCFPKENLWLEPVSLKKLKKLYIVGGQVEKIDIQDESDTKMNVKMIRLKFLHKLRMEWPELEIWFPQLNYLEIYDCPKIQHCPQLDKEYVWIADGKPVAGSTREEPTLSRAPTQECVSGTTVPPAPPSTDTITTTDVPANPPANPPPFEGPVVPRPTGNVPTSTDTSVVSQTTDADEATKTSSPPIETPTSKSLPTSSSKSPRSSSLTTELVSPPDIPDRASIVTDSSSPTTNTSSSPAPVAPSGLGHTSTTPTSASLVPLATGNVPTSIQDTISQTADADGATRTSSPPIETPTSKSLPTSTSKSPRSSSLATTELVGPPDAPDHASITTDNSATTTNTSNTPSSSLANSSVVGPSAIPDILSSIPTDTSSPTSAIQNQEMTHTTTPDSSSSQASPHLTSPTTDAPRDTPSLQSTPSDPSSSLSSQDQGNVVADSTSITPTSSSPAAQNDASVPATLSAHDQDTNAAHSLATGIDTVVANPPGAPVLAPTPIDSAKIASSATQEAPDKSPPLATPTDSTIGTAVVKTVSTPDSVKDSAPASMSTPTVASPV
ncbi:hypothetical protein AQUCO_01600001v1 [Aquilegia coerulea]|uniref:Rx N-terminal domain-containing protein n=1 Tax=Aquilegia coerulea TaxID=218851 RepID=A0A2G5DQI5_AQUCA|nr:hypothetical protein AQUCO_01600001v1 [Aquilegia coerulea]